METLTARLSKPTTGSLGLSLATVNDALGIYIRHVADGSVAAQDGTLRVGDRLHQVRAPIARRRRGRSTRRR